MNWFLGKNKVNQHFGISILNTGGVLQLPIQKIFATQSFINSLPSWIHHLELCKLGGYKMLRASLMHTYAMWN